MMKLKYNKYKLKTRFLITFILFVLIFKIDNVNSYKINRGGDHEEKSKNQLNREERSIVLDSSSSESDESIDSQCMVYKEFIMHPKKDPYFNRNVASVSGYICNHTVDPLVSDLQTFTFEPFTTVADTGPNWLKMYVQVTSIDIYTGIAIDGHQEKTTLYNLWVHLTQSNGAYRLVIGQQSASNDWVIYK